MRQVIARYSALKLGGWIVAVVAVSVSILAEGVRRGWQTPAGMYGWLFPGAVLGSVLALMVSAALAVNFVLARGAAIARTGDHLVLYLPLGWRRVPLRSDLMATACGREIEVSSPTWTMSAMRRPWVSELRLHRTGQPDIVFRTGLLRETAETIATRLAALST
jgi:hypothetical protein